MKKILFLTVIISLILTATACKKNEPTYIDNVKVNGDKSVFNNEIPTINKTNKNTTPDVKSVEKDSKDQTKTPDTKQTTTVVMQKDKFTEKQGQQSSAYSALSNKKIGWGVKRNSNHTTPEVSSSTREMFIKYNTLFVGDESKKVVYLTFDEGYENGYTAKILDTLKANNVKATFFVTGPYVQKDGDLVERMINEGHIVGNHTINHKSGPDLNVSDFEKEVVGLDRMIYDKWKVNVKYMRPPMGEYSERTLAQLKDLGFTTVLWSFAYKDYDVNDQKGTQYAHDMVMNNIHPGAILLLHAVSKDNANALDSIIKDIRAQGYEIQNLDEIQ